MLIPNKFNGYQAGRRTYNVGVDPLTLAAMSAVANGGFAAAQGKNPLEAAVKGAALGALGGGIGQFLGGAGAGAGATELASVGAADATSGLLGSPLTQAYATPISLGESIATTALPSMNQGAISALAEAPMSGLDFGALNSAGIEGAVAQAAPEVAQAATTQGGLGSLPAAQQASAQPLSVMGQQANPQLGYNVPKLTPPPAGKVGFMDSPTQWWKNLPFEKKVLYGGGGLGALMLMDRMGNKVPGQAPYNGPLSRFRYDPDKYIPAAIPTRSYMVNMASGGVAGYAGGGIADLGSYSDGGRLLKGPGDGMSDNIPATISNKRPARLADGEFVVPADVVSHLGNGSTDAGAKQLYAMMDKVRRARTGNKKQGRQINPGKFMPA